MISEDFKWHRIYPGLGKTQSRIMQILEEEGKAWGTKGMMGIENLTSKVYYPDLRGATMWMGDEYPITKSQYNNVHRAVRALEKRGLVKTNIVPLESLKGIRYRKTVGILPDKY